METIATETLKRWGLCLTDEQCGRLDIFRKELLEKNARFNLFSGNDAEHLWTRHILDALAGAALGFEVVTTPVGFKWIYEEMVKGGVLIGGEESGGIGIPTHVRERDGLLMALLLAEMMAQRGKSLSELVTEMFAVTGPLEYNRIDMKLTVEAMADFRSRMPDFAPAELGGLEVREISRVDGVKFFLPDDAWLAMDQRRTSHCHRNRWQC